MSEHEKQLQIGKLAEEFSLLKGELNHVEEKLVRAKSAAWFMGQNFQNMNFVDGKFVTPMGHHGNPANGSLTDLPSLLNYSELQDAFIERNRLRSELANLTNRLRTVAPHLI